MAEREDSQANAILQAAYQACAAQGYALTPEQQVILAEAIAPYLPATPDDLDRNPLDDLADGEREAFLAFVAEQTQQDRPWKAQLLNDWLTGQDSGSVQFIRESYGVSWLEQIQPHHIAAYQRPNHLQVGDRIEVANNLWEWVQADGPSSREWLPCTVIQVTQGTDPQTGRSLTTCTVRFDTGMEYEIQGVYDWNQYNWRWLGESL